MPLTLRDTMLVKQCVDKSLGEFLETKLKPELDRIIEGQLVAHGVIFPPWDMKDSEGIMVYQSPERLFLKCMKCDLPIEAEERYVIQQYANARKLDDSLRRWTRVQNGAPYTCIDTKERVKEDDEIVVLHEKCYDGMVEKHGKQQN